MHDYDGQSFKLAQRLNVALARKLEAFPVNFVASLLTGMCIMMAILFGTFWILVVNWIWLEFFEQGAAIDLQAAYFVIIGTTAPIAYPLFIWFTSMTQMIQKTRRELAATAEEAKEASRMKSAFLASTSHEIRTPLNGIAGVAQLLARSDLSTEQKEHVRLLNEASQSLSRLLGDILDISKVEAGRMSLAPAPTDFRAIIKANASLWSPAAMGKGLKLKSTIDKHTPRWLFCDGERIRQCIANLTSNAVKFTESGSVELTIESRELESGELEVSVQVSDTGPGIDEVNHERIFEAFEQIGDADKRRAGTGLGLAITRNLAQIMGGDIILRSTPGVGSDFIFTFKAKACEAPEQPRLEPLATPMDGLRLLVTDDNATNRTVANLLLRSAGHEVELAEGGRETLKILEEQTFDAVLLDMHMPEMDGPETLRRIREAGKPWSEVKVIALTADAMPGDRDKYLDMGMDGYAVKPIDLEKLLAEITRVHSAPTRTAA